MKITSASATSNGVQENLLEGKRQKYYRFNVSKEKNQINKKKKFLKKDNDSLYLNFTQREMYRRLMYGLKNYSSEQIEAMSRFTQNKISKDFNQAQKQIHIIKAKQLYYAETKLFDAICPHLNLQTKDSNWLGLKIPQNMTLRKLNIKPKEIIDTFINKKLLPENFYTMEVKL